MASPRKFEIMSIKARFGINKELAHNKGAACVIDEMTFFVTYHSPSNRVWATIYDEIWKPHRVEPTEELTIELNRQAFVKGILLGWENVRESVNDETPLEFSQETALRLLTEYPELYSELNNFSYDRSNFLIGDPKADSKN